MPRITLTKKTSTPTGSSKITLKIKTKGDAKPENKFIESLQTAMDMVIEADNKTMDVTADSNPDTTPDAIPDATPYATPDANPDTTPDATPISDPITIQSKPQIHEFTPEHITSVKNDINRIYTYNKFPLSLFTNLRFASFISHLKLSQEPLKIFNHIIDNLELESKYDISFVITGLIKSVLSETVAEFLKIAVEKKPRIKAFITDGMTTEIIEKIILGNHYTDLKFLINSLGLMTTKLDVDSMEIILSRSLHQYINLLADLLTNCAPHFKALSHSDQMRIIGCIMARPDSSSVKLNLIKILI